MIIAVLSVCVVPNIKDFIFLFLFCFLLLRACVRVCKNDSFYLRGTGKFFLVPNMLLQTWFLLLFCEAVVYMKL